MMLLFIIAPVYHSDIMAPAVFQIYDKIYWQQALVHILVT